MPFILGKFGLEPLRAEHQVHKIRLIALRLGITISLVIVSPGHITPACGNTLVHHTRGQGANMDQGNVKQHKATINELIPYWEPSELLI